MKVRVHKDSYTVNLTKDEYKDLLDLTRQACIYGVDYTHSLTDDELNEVRNVKARVWKMICNILYR